MKKGLWTSIPTLLAAAGISFAQPSEPMVLPRDATTATPTASPLQP